MLLILASLGPLDSKTAQVGVPLSLGVYATVLLLRRWQGAVVTKRLVAVGVAVTFVAALAVLVRLMAAAGVSDWSDFVAQSSFGFRPARLERMRQLMLMFLEHPVAGTGVGTFVLLLPGYFAKYGAPFGGVAYLEATNHLFHMAATGGLIGLGATVWMLLAFFAKPLSGLLCSGSDAKSSWPIGDAALAGALTYLVASNWQGETWYHVPVASVFWLLLALAVKGAPVGSWFLPVMSVRSTSAMIAVAAVALFFYV